MYKHLFGPVPSRRLGISLGVDLVPYKVCSFDCVYCECGATTKLTLSRKEYVSYEDVIYELTDYLNNNSAPDYITFSGSGEPTLNIGIGKIISFIKSEYPSIKVAVLTNGSLLNFIEVRRDILKADVVLPSLDSASLDTFKKINRPIDGFDLNDYIKGLVDFRKEYKGEIWLEIMILKGYNDNLKDLKLLFDAIIRINPDIIQLNTLDRPGAIKGLKAVSYNYLQSIIDMWGLENVEIIASSLERRNVKSYSGDIEDLILKTIARRPCTINDLAVILGIHVNEVNKYISTLEAEKKITSSIEDRGVFYSIK